MSKPARKRKAIPKFRSDEKAGEFWLSHDVAEYLDLSKAQPVCFAKLRPSTATISLRLPQAMLEERRVLANERDVPYQSLLKVFLVERIAQERKPARAPRRPSV